MESDSDSSTDVFEDAVETIYTRDDLELHQTCPSSEKDSGSDSVSQERKPTTENDLLSDQGDGAVRKNGSCDISDGDRETDAAHTVGREISLERCRYQDSPVNFNVTIKDATAVSVGGPVVVNSSAKIENLRRKTDEQIQNWTCGMIPTKGSYIVQQKITQGKKWITITGGPGEGKTTTGYLVLKYLHSQGRKVFDLNTPKDYFRIKDESDPVVMVNDIFGSLHFDLGKVKTWEEFFKYIFVLNEHSDTKEPKTDLPTVILISRTRVLRAASCHLGRYKNMILDKECEVDLTNMFQSSEEERMAIWKYYADKYKININDDLINQVCQMPLPYGFPHCCRLFVNVYNQNKEMNMKEFFAKPLEFLSETMELLIMDSTTGPLLREILRDDGSLDLNNIIDDEKRFRLSSTVETLTGIYLTQAGGLVRFHHPSVYESAAYVMCRKDPLFVIRHCSLPFLNERVRFEELCVEKHCESQDMVIVTKSYIKIFLHRLKTEFDNGYLRLTLSHQSFHNESFVTDFMESVCYSECSFESLLQKKDRISKESFLFLMTKSRSHYILKYMWEHVNLEQLDKSEIIFGICEHISVSALLFILEKCHDLNLNVKNSDLQTPLLIASVKSSKMLMKALLKEGVDVTAKDEKGNTALHNICRHGLDDDGEVVKMLIDKGSEVDQETSEYPFLPLHTACYSGHLNVVIALLENGASVNKVNKVSYTPIHYACRMGHINVVLYLLGKGADIDITNRDGDTPLHRSCSEGHLDIVKKLTDKVYDVNLTNAGGDTPLHCASYRGHYDVVRVLLDRGASVNKSDINGNSPLHTTCHWNRLDIVELLLERGANINQRDTWSCGDTPLHDATSEGNIKVVKMLLDNGANINVTNNSGSSPLHAACSGKHVDIVNCLLNRGADINLKNIVGNTPLNNACRRGHICVVRTLLRWGADINVANNDGNTPLYTACNGAYSNIVSLLLDKGATIDSDFRRMTMLLWLMGYQALIHISR